jgi:hypothetical protein
MIISILGYQLYLSLLSLRFLLYLVIIAIAIIGWNLFKLEGRGLV